MPAMNAFGIFWLQFMHDQIAPIPVWSGEGGRDRAWSEPLAGIVAGPGRDTDAIYGGQSCPRRKWGKEEEEKSYRARLKR